MFYIFHTITFATIMNNYLDTYRHKGLRKQLVEILKNRGITNENVISAINNIPRHFF